MGTRVNVRRLFRRKAAAGVPRRGDLCLDLGVQWVWRAEVGFRISLGDPELAALGSCRGSDSRFLSGALGWTVMLFTDQVIRGRTGLGETFTVL